MSLNCHKNLWRQWHSTPVLLPGKSHGRRSLLGCNPWGQSLRVGQDWATSLSLSCIGEGNGNPLQCYCLENPRDGAAWWAAVYGVAQSWARLKRLSSSSSSSRKWQPTLVFLLGRVHGQRSLTDYSPCNLKRIRHDWATKEQENTYTYLKFGHYYERQRKKNSAN